MVDHSSSRALLGVASTVGSTARPSVRSDGRRARTQGVLPKAVRGRLLTCGGLTWEQGASIDTWDVAADPAPGHAARYYRGRLLMVSPDAGAILRGGRQPATPPTALRRSCAGRCRWGWHDAGRGGPGQETVAAARGACVSAGRRTASPRRPPRVRRPDFSSPRSPVGATAAATAARPGFRCPPRHRRRSSRLARPELPVLAAAQGSARSSVTVSRVPCHRNGFI